jgi:hypothetical protein
MVISHSYVKLPEGKIPGIHRKSHGEFRKVHGLLEEVQSLSSSLEVTCKTGAGFFGGQNAGIFRENGRNVWMLGDFLWENREI